MSDIVVRFGNRAPLQAPEGGFEDIDAADKGKLVPYGDGVPVETVFRHRRARYIDEETGAAVDGGVTSAEFFQALTTGKAWKNHSGDLPTWVESNDEGLERLCASQWGCPRGAPTDVEKTHLTHQGPPGEGTYERLAYVEPGPIKQLTRAQVKLLHQSSHGLIEVTGTDGKVTTVAKLISEIAREHGLPDLSFLDLDDKPSALTGVVTPPEVPGAS